MATPLTTIQLHEQSTCWSCGNAVSETDGFCVACLWNDIATAADEGVDVSTEAKLPTAVGNVPGHELVRELARGGMGVVYLARQLNPEREVAVKMLLPWQMGSASLRARFQLEAEALSLLDHPVILPLYQIGTADGVPWFSMKLVTGGTLSNHRARLAGKWRDIAGLMILLANGIAFAHERGVLHRDLKPSNVLFDARGRPYIADFGLAKLLDHAPEQGLTQPASVMGTPQYLAPEVAESGAAVATTASDIYGLGALMYELLAQRPLFEAPLVSELMRMVRQELPLPIDAKHSIAGRSAVPRDLETITRKCLNKAPAERYATAHTLAADLQAWLDGQPISAQPTTLFMRLKAWSRRRPALAASITMLCVTGAAASAAQWRALEKTRAERREAETLVEYLNGELTDKLAPTGRLDLVSGIHERLARWYAAHPGRTEPEFFLQRARFLFNRARAQNYAGKWEEATASLQEAITLAEPLPVAGAARLVADAYQMLGADIYPIRNLPAEGRQARNQAAAHLLATVQLYPQEIPEIEWRVQLGSIYYSSVYNAIEENNAPLAKVALDSEAAALAPLSTLPEPPPSLRNQQSQLEYGRGLLALALGHPDEAAGHYRHHLDTIISLAQEQPTEPRWQESWAVANSRLAEALIKQPDKRAEALEAWRSATLISRRLLMADPVNANLLRTLIRVDVALGRNLEQDNTAESTMVLEEAATLSVTRLQNSVDPSDWLDDASDAFRAYAKHLQKVGRAEQAHAWWHQLMESTSSKFDGSYGQTTVAYVILLEACHWEKHISPAAATDFAQTWVRRCIDALAQPGRPAAQSASWQQLQINALGIDAWYLMNDAPEHALPLWQQAVQLSQNVANPWPTEPGYLRSRLRFMLHLATTASALQRPTELLSAIRQGVTLWQSASPETRTKHSLDPLLKLGLLAIQTTDRAAVQPLAYQIYQAGIELKQTGDAMTTLQSFTKP